MIPQPPRAITSVLGLCSAAASDGDTVQPEGRKRRRAETRKRSKKRHRMTTTPAGGKYWVLLLGPRVHNLTKDRIHFRRRFHVPHRSSES